jgi:hypothetical protein
MFSSDPDFKRPLPRSKVRTGALSTVRELITSLAKSDSRYRQTQLTSFVTVTPSVKLTKFTRRPASVSSPESDTHLLAAAAASALLLPLTQSAPSSPRPTPSALSPASPSPSSLLPSFTHSLPPSPVYRDHPALKEFTAPIHSPIITRSMSQKKKVARNLGLGDLDHSLGLPVSGIKTLPSSNTPLNTPSNMDSRDSTPANVGTSTPASSIATPLLLCPTPGWTDDVQNEDGSLPDNLLLQELQEEFREEFIPLALMDDNNPEFPPLPPPIRRQTKVATEESMDSTPGNSKRPRATDSPAKGQKASKISALQDSATLESSSDDSATETDTVKKAARKVDEAAVREQQQQQQQLQLQQRQQQLQQLHQWEEEKAEMKAALAALQAQTQVLQDKMGQHDSAITGLLHYEQTSAAHLEDHSKRFEDYLHKMETISNTLSSHALKMQEITALQGQMTAKMAVNEAEIHRIQQLQRTRERDIDSRLLLLDRQLKELSLASAGQAAPSGGRTDQDVAFYIHGIMQLKAYGGFPENADPTEPIIKLMKGWHEYSAILRMVVADVRRDKMRNQADALIVVMTTTLHKKAASSRLKQYLKEANSKGYLRGVSIKDCFGPAEQERARALNRYGGHLREVNQISGYRVINKQGPAVLQTYCGNSRWEDHIPSEEELEPFYRTRAEREGTSMEVEGQEGQEQPGVTAAPQAAAITPAQQKAIQKQQEKHSSKQPPQQSSQQTHQQQQQQQQPSFSHTKRGRGAVIGVQGGPPRGAAPFRGAARGSARGAAAGGATGGAAGGGAARGGAAGGAGARGALSQPRLSQPNSNPVVPMPGSDKSVQIAQKVTEMKKLQAELAILQGSEAAALEASDRDESGIGYM